MKTINKLTALSVALKYLRETHEIAIHRLMPWNLLWTWDSSFSKDYEKTKFEFEDRGELLKMVDASSVSEEFLKQEFKDESQDCLETVIHYMDILKEILADLILMKNRERLMGLLQKDDIERQKRIEAEYPVPDYLRYNEWWSHSLNDNSKFLEAVGTCLETRWVTDWLLMCIGVMPAEHLVMRKWPKFSDDCDSYSFLPLSSWLAWEPFFLVHQIKAKVFSEYFWAVDSESPSLLKAGTVREFLDKEMDGRGGEHSDSFLYGQDLRIFTTRAEHPIGAVMSYFKEWGYSVDDAWEFFRPESGFFSRIFQPSAQGEDNYEPVDEDIVADEIFRKFYIPKLFKKLIGVPSKQNPKSKPKKKK